MMRNYGCCQQTLQKDYNCASSSEISYMNAITETRCEMKVICSSYAMALMHHNKTISNCPNLIFFISYQQQDIITI